MLQYLIYFLLGGVVVASVAYLGGRGNVCLAAFVASLPTLFLLDVFLMYRVGGVDSSLTYVIRYRRKMLRLAISPRRDEEYL